MKRDRDLRVVLAMAMCLVLSESGGAIVMRHDRDEQAFLDLLTWTSMASATWSA